MPRLFQTPSERSRALWILGFFVVWTCLYAGLRATREPDAGGFSRTGGEGPAPANGEAVSLANAAGPDAEDALELPCKVFHFPKLTMSGLGVVLGDWGLRLEYPPSARSLVLQGSRLGGRTRAAILMDLLRPHEYGFSRAGNVIHVLPVDLKQARKERDALGPLKSSRLRTDLQVKAGEPADLWVGSEPLVRLRIVAQPLYGETNTGAEVSVTIEGRRDFQPWFQQNLETLLAQPASIEVKGRQNAWCLVTPKTLEKDTVTLEVDFYYEANLPIE